MASTSGGSGHGGKRNNSGRKRKFEDRGEYKKAWLKSHKRIYLEERIFKSWLQAKLEAGYESFSDSDFAAHLLSLEYRRRALEDTSSVSRGPKPHVPRAIEESEGPQTSTPVKRFRQLSETVVVSPIVVNVPSPADICSPSGVEFTDENTRLSSSHENLNTSLFTDDEGSDEELEYSFTEENTSYRNLCNSAILDLNEDMSFDESESDSDDSIVPYNENASSEGENYELLQIDAEVCTGDQDTESGSIVNNATTSSEELEDGPQYGPHRKLSRGEDLHEFRKELKMVNERKFLCSLDLFLDLFVGCCRIPGCSEVPQVKHHFVGTTVVVTTKCPTGHIFKFASSREVNGLYANNLQSAAAVLLSGNNLAKIIRMTEFLGLSFLSESTFYRMQRLYLFPAVEEWWGWMREELINVFVGEKVVVGGDGQCDSPGFTAKNLCYFLMELTSGYILEIEVRDKRHVGLASTNMEKVALKNALTRLTQVLNVVEVATDASSSIKKFIANEFKDIFHSLDVWHKSKSIRKCLAKIGQSKAMQKIKAWTDHIIRHFWYCSSACMENENTSDEEALDIMKSKWFGLLHHVCNSHEWLGGKCDHDEESHDADLPWFDRRDKDYLELQKVILNQELLDSFKFYVRFRHTGKIECANSLTLVYTPKRTPLSYKAFKARKQLATIDWNFHLDLPSATNKSGNEITSRKYNQRTKQWDVKTVKQDKSYEYVPLLISRIFRARLEDNDLMTRNVSLNESDPRLIAPTIAAKPPPSSKELLKRKSRFTVPSKNANPTTGEVEGEMSSND